MPLGWIRLGCVAAASVVGLAAASAAEAAPFDGTWSVLQVCDSTQEGARGYTWRYDAAVKEQLPERKRLWMTRTTPGHRLPPGLPLRPARHTLVLPLLVESEVVVAW